MVAAFTPRALHTSQASAECAKSYLWRCRLVASQNSEGHAAQILRRPAMVVMAWPPSSPPSPPPPSPPLPSPPPPSVSPSPPRAKEQPVLERRRRRLVQAQDRPSPRPRPPPSVVGGAWEPSSSPSPQEGRRCRRRGGARLRGEVDQPEAEIVGGDQEGRRPSAIGDGDGGRTAAAEASTRARVLIEWSVPNYVCMCELRMRIFVLHLVMSDLRLGHSRH